MQCVIHLLVVDYLHFLLSISSDQTCLAGKSLVVDYLHFLLSILSNQTCLAGKYLACIVASGACQLLTVLDWRNAKETARQDLSDPTTCLAWSDSTTLMTAGPENFKASLLEITFLHPLHLTKPCKVISGGQECGNSDNLWQLIFPCLYYYFRLPSSST